MRKYVLDSYIKNVYNNQSLGNSDYANLCSIEEYQRIYSYVERLLMRYHNRPIEEIREELYLRSGIEDGIRDFIINKGMAPGAVISFGTPNYEEVITIGNAREVVKEDANFLQDGPIPMEKDTIFDLASVSKIFITLSILKLAEHGILSVNDEIVKYAPEFINLKGVTIFDLLTFKVPLITDKRLELASDKEEAQQILFNIKVNDNSILRAYTDMGAMVLKYVIEHAANMKYYDFLKESILEPLHMKDTLYKPANKHRLASTNYEGKLLSDNVATISYFRDGEVHDPKARIMQSTSGDLCGHAGVFSTAGDMAKLARSIIDGTLLSADELNEITTNRTGAVYYENDIKKASQYFGYLCYLKNPIAYNSEVYHALSGKSFAYAGFTGTQFTIDPVNGIYYFLGSNRTHNRATYIDKGAAPHVYKNINGRKMAYLNEQGFYVVSQNFAFEKDPYLVNPIMNLCLAYKMLDDMYELNRDKFLQRIRQII